MLRALLVLAVPYASSEYHPRAPRASPPVAGRRRSGLSFLTPPPTPKDMSARAAASDPDAARQHWLVVDFDGTCTVRDTTPALVNLASAGASDGADARAARAAAFASLEGEYFAAYRGEIGDVLPDGGVGRGAPDRTLAEALKGLDDISSRITARVSSSGCLAGIPEDPDGLSALLLRDGVGDGGVYDLHDGCVEALAEALGAGWRLGVLSINWCPQLIDCVLLGPLRDRDAAGRHGDHAFPVWSNRLRLDGTVELAVPGADSKRDRVASLRAGGGVVVYVGDSSTDLLALIEADVGILLLRQSSSSGASSTAERMCDRWKVPLVPLSERGGGDGGRGTVWTTRSWAEIAGTLCSEF